MDRRLHKLFDLTGKRALVTGGGSGMGKEFTRILSEAGATVMIAARDGARLKTVAEEIADATGRAVHHISVDLSSEAGADMLADAVHQRLGEADIFVGNAGMDMHSTVEDFDWDVFQRCITTNFYSNVWLTRALTPAMRKKGWGRIIYTSSLAARSGFNNLKLGLYGASKAALESYARYAAAELGGAGITVNIIAPGAIATPLSEASPAYADQSDEDVRAEMRDYLASLNPMNRWGQPHELAGTLLLLASDAGSYLNGTWHPIDGGWTAMGDSIRT